MTATPASTSDTAEVRPRRRSLIRILKSQCPEYIYYIKPRVRGLLRNGYMKKKRNANTPLEGMRAIASGMTSNTSPGPPFTTSWIGTPR